MQKGSKVKEKLRKSFSKKRGAGLFAPTTNGSKTKGGAAFEMGGKKKY